jgi:hypothetical protein
MLTLPMMLLRQLLPSYIWRQHQRLPIHVQTQPASPELGPDETTQHLRPTTIIVSQRLGTTLIVTRSLRIPVITYW